MSAKSSLTTPPIALAASLAEEALRAPDFAPLWEKLRAGQSITLDHVAHSGWPFAAALAIQAMPHRRAWILCPDARAQEQIHADLGAWGVAAFFFPKLATGDSGPVLADPQT